MCDVLGTWTTIVNNRSQYSAMAQSQCLCLVCGGNIDDHQDRRRLHSDVNKDSLSTLVDIAAHRGVQLDQLEARIFASTRASVMFGGI